MDTKSTQTVKRRIAIQSLYFLEYDADPNRPLYTGGGVRYLRDLGRLFHKHGYEVHYIQKAKRSFHGEFEGWAYVHGVAAPQGAGGDVIYARGAYELTSGFDLVCYGNMEDCFPYVRPNSFAVQHGVWWDCQLPTWKRWIQLLRVRYVANRVGLTICVDTNFANWYRTQWPQDTSALRRFHYIPNYADLDVFRPASKRPTGRPVLLFPRRFERKRGYHLFIEACSRLRSLGFDFDVQMVGTGSARSDLETLAASVLGSGVTIAHATFETISRYYSQAYLTFIPTLWSEGTSLSAVEAICSGCPVIATDVGGLGNIVVPGFNGEVCPPNVEDLVRVTAELLKHPDRRDQLAENCLRMREALGKTRWEARIMDLVARLLLSGTS